MDTLSPMLARETPEPALVPDVIEIHLSPSPSKRRKLHHSPAPPTLPTRADGLAGQHEETDISLDNVLEHRAADLQLPARGHGADGADGADDGVQAAAAQAADKSNDGEESGGSEAPPGVVQNAAGQQAESRQDTPNQESPQLKRAITKIMDEDLDVFDVKWADGRTGQVSKVQANKDAPELVARWRAKHGEVCAITAIVGEKGKQFQVVWAGTDSQGQPWPHEWVPKSAVGKAAVKEWRSHHLVRKE